MGKIKMGGNATMEFDPDYYEFHITVSVISGTSGNAISKGRSRTEEILCLLQDKLGFDIKNFTLKDEKTSPKYDRKDGYEFEKKFYFCYKADNSITESVVALLETMSDVEYEVKFKLENESEKEQLVMSSAVDNAREKAEKLATALGSHINGFEEIKYEFKEETDKDKPNVKWFGIASCIGKSLPKSLASDLKNPKIKISKTVEIIWLTD